MNNMFYFEQKVSSPPAKIKPDYSNLNTFGRGCETHSDLPIMCIDTCICFREKTGSVLCRNCGHLMFGRKRISCPEHPNIVFLMDHSACTKCRAFGYMLREIDARLENCHKMKKGTKLHFNGALPKIAANFDVNNNN